MDTESFGFRYEEHFPIFDSNEYMHQSEDDSQSYDGGFGSTANQNVWEWDNEQELNGDMALIPVSSGVESSFMSSSPPNKEDFQKIMSEWQHLANMDGYETNELVEDMQLSMLHSEIDIKDVVLLEDMETTDVTSTCHDPLPSASVASIPGGTNKFTRTLLDFEDHKELSEERFDITTYINNRDEAPKKNASIGKKIDMQAQCYVINDPESDHVDVETVSDVEGSPVLEAQDLNSLLEQFEATETTTEKVLQVENRSTSIKSRMPREPSVAPVSSKTEEQKETIIDTNPKRNSPNKEQRMLKQNAFSKMVDVVKEQQVSASLPVPFKEGKDFEAKPVTAKNCVIQKEPTDFVSMPGAKEQEKSMPMLSCTEEEEKFVSVPMAENVVGGKKLVVNSHLAEESDKKQILQALPQELIMKIKASSKRKPIPVIEAIPNKRRGLKRPAAEVTTSFTTVTLPKAASPVLVHLDHDYCSAPSLYPKQPKKDSGFESGEEEDQRSILKNQPTFKGANGKLMVSLLKINTIRNRDETEHNRKKRKLNLEEYKKRREGFTTLIRSSDTSQTNSPGSSGPNSPIVEDENIRRIKHQQKLLEMATEVLRTPPKSAQKLISIESTPTSKPASPIPPRPRTPPPDMEVKTIISIGINTDESFFAKNPIVQKKVVTNLRPLVPDLLPEEIKPILSKINPNSLLTSLIENIQNKNNGGNASPQSQNTRAVNKENGEHGEDKTILYLAKNRPPVSTCSVQVQTPFDDEKVPENIQERRRSSSSNSSRSSRSYRRRNRSSESQYSSSSLHSSSSSSYRSQSRSPSPSFNRASQRHSSSERERLKEVEERRIVYVGGISSSTSRDELRRRFQQFGPICNVSIHFREYGDNYGFVTFVYKVDAYEAVEHGNDDRTLPQYDLSFGGRRIFCRARYSDLDNIHDDITSQATQKKEDSFDNLLREVQAKLRKRKVTS